MILNTVTVRAPATSANLGPGFDCIGMALDIWNELTLTRGEFSVSAVGEGADLVPRDSSNLVVTGVEAVFKYIGELVPGLQYECTNRVPFSRGMGSADYRASDTKNVRFRERKKENLKFETCKVAASAGRRD